MTKPIAMPTQTRERLLFVRRWFAHPLRMGAMLPSSPALVDLVARNAARPGDEAILELGAGTGTITAALVARGVREERLLLVELDDDMADWLRRRFPAATVIRGDASRPAELVPAAWHGRIGTVLSGIPVLRFSLADQRTFVAQCFALTGPQGRLLQYSYSPVAPLPARQLGLARQRLGVAFGNLPPGFLWSFTPDRQLPPKVAASQRGSA